MLGNKAGGWGAGYNGDAQSAGLSAIGGFGGGAGDKAAHCNGARLRIPLVDVELTVAGGRGQEIIFELPLALRQRSHSYAKEENLIGEIVFPRARVHLIDIRDQGPPQVSRGHSEETLSHRQPPARAVYIHAMDIITIQANSRSAILSGRGVDLLALIAH